MKKLISMFSIVAIFTTSAYAFPSGTYVCYVKFTEQTYKFFLKPNGRMKLIMDIGDLRGLGDLRGNWYDDDDMARIIYDDPKIGEIRIYQKGNTYLFGHPAMKAPCIKDGAREERNIVVGIESAEPNDELECSQGNAMACMNLSGKYEMGIGVRKDFSKAFSFASQACKLGARAGVCATLGNFYYLGKGVKKDKLKAIEIYKKACEEGVGRGWCEIYERVSAEVISSNIYTPPSTLNCSPYVVVTVNQLNFRNSPGKPSSIIGRANRGDRVCVYGFSGKWGRTEQGWISGKYLREVGSTSIPPKKGTRLSESECVNIDFGELEVVTRLPEQATSYGQYIKANQKVRASYQKYYNHCNMSEQDYASILRRLKDESENEWQRKNDIRMINKTGAPRNAPSGWGPDGTWSGPDFRS